MAEQRRDLANTRRTNWAVKWNGTDIGYVDKVDPSALKLGMDPIQVGTIGKAALGVRFTGLEGTVKVQVRECTLLQLQTVIPWYTAGATFPFTPPINKDLYDYAKELLLHPEDKGATVTEDVHLLKTVPISVANIARDGTKDDVWEIEFMVFPDRSSLPNLVYGRIGDVVTP
jgi:hypothetical protein